jgi:hypothetical protein
VADASSPPGSPGWARTVRELIADAISREATYADRAWSLIREFKQNEAWRHLQDRAGAPFANLKQFSEHPRPEGLGISFSRLKQIENDHREWLKKQTEILDEAPAVGAPKGNTNASKNNRYIVPIVSKDDTRGNKAETVIRRIKKAAAKGDDRALAALEGLKEGRYPSARAAGLDAGVVRPPDPIRAMHTAIKKALPEPPKSFDSVTRDTLSAVRGALGARKGQARVTLAYELIRMAEEALRQ